MMRWIFFWTSGFLVPFVLLPHWGYAQKPVVLDESLDSLILGTYSEVLPDPKGQWTLQEIFTPTLQQQFKQNESDILSVGFTETVYWFRFTLENPLTESQEWLLEFPYLTMNWIELHRPLPSGGYEMVRTGDTFPLETRDMHHENFVFKLLIPPQQTLTFYFRANSQGGAMVVPLILSRTHSFYERTKPRATFWGLFFGFLGLLIVYSFFQYTSSRDKGYLFYSLTMFSVGTHYLIFSGWGNFYVWSHWGIPLMNNFLPEILVASVIFYIFYCQALLDSKTHLPRMHVILKLNAYLGGGLVLLFTTPYFFRIQAANFYLLGSMLLVIPPFWLRYRQNYEPALYPLLGVLAISLTSGYNTYRTVFGNAPATGLDTTVLIGIMIDILMLSFALNSRYKILRIEKEQAQQDKLEMQATLVEELKRTDQLKDDFLANTSHELSTPLHGIIGLCQAMERRDSPMSSEEQLKNLSLMENSARRLSHLVNDILDFSRVKNQDLQLRPRCFQIQSSLHLVCSLCESSLGQKPIQLSKQFPEAPLYVNADEARLQQILFNLLSNAIKFTHEGEIVLQARQQSQHVEISISDTGIGIAPEKQAIIFQPFTQADGSISREYGGTGLGLAISQQLVQLHGSQLEVESVVGQGTRFSFCLPLASEEASAQSNPLPSEKSLHLQQPSLMSLVLEKAQIPLASLPKPLETAPTILVVDDEPLNIEILKYQLIQERYQVQSALDGKEALTMLEQKIPDLILLDLMMPRMNGYEACQKIREHHSKAELPILLLTAKGQMKDLVLGLQVGANDYLTKPFYQEELLARIKSQLSHRKAFEIQQENQRLTGYIEQIEKTEAILKLSEKRLSQALDHAKEAILVVDEGGKIIFHNQAFSRLLGYSSEQVLHQLLATLLPQEVKHHPLQWPFNPNHWKNLKTSKHVTLKKQNGEDWNCRVWGESLDLETETWIFTFAPPPSSQEAAVPVVTQWIQSLCHSRHRLQEFISVLQELPAMNVENQPAILEDLNTMDQSLEKLCQFIGTPEQNDNFGSLLVQVMNDSVDCWKADLRKGVIELAEESGLWAVNMDGDRLRARSLERYLDLSKLPKKPRWRNVIKTGHFVLTQSASSSTLKIRLQKSLNQLIQATHQRNLSPPLEPR